MQIQRKRLSAAIALALTLTIAATLITCLPAATALTAVPDRESGAFVSVYPKVVGISQEVLINIWVFPAPAGPQMEGGSGAGNRYQNLTVTITKPGGTKDIFMPVDMGSIGTTLAPGETEEIGSIVWWYKPDKIGQYSASFSFPGKNWTMAGFTVWIKPCTSQTVTFVVQEDPVQMWLPPVDLPTGYWETPIHTDNREWSKISGDWLGRANIVSGEGGYTTWNGGFNPYSTGPNSAHILWKKQLGMGGIVGGEWGSLSYMTWNAGIDVFIINGKVYYNIDGGKFCCVNLYTGELLWTAPGTLTADRAETLIPNIEYAETQGPYTYLWELGSSQWKRYLPFSGTLDRTISNVPSGFSVNSWVSDDEVYLIRGDRGRFNTTIPDRLPINELIRWNLSKVTGNNWITGIVWNVTQKQADGTGNGEGGRGPRISKVSDDVVVTYCQGERKFYAYNAKTGAKLWIYDCGFNWMQYTWTTDRTLILEDTSTMTWHCYRIDFRSGATTELWHTQVGEYPWGSTGRMLFDVDPYGIFYTWAYDGYWTAIDAKSGKIEWRTYLGNLTEAQWNTYATYCDRVIADGKLYGGSSEHSPTQPLLRGQKLFCVDAYTGEHLWNISGAMGACGIADGYLIGASESDVSMYCFGKGKTATTVSAPQTVVAKGSSVMIQGTVLDQSPAQKGTPAIADESMSAWMEYLHMQKPMPMNTIGVTVTLDALDPNGNFIPIGTVTSDASGMFKKMWTPDVPGEYTVIATFQGSESYWSSYAETAVGVSEAPQTTQESVAAAPDNTPIFAGIMVAIVVVAILVAINIVLQIRKQRK